MTLLELAERCEKATGPDRELDVAIRDTVFQPCINPGAVYTASLDAAMTLVPEGSRKRAVDMDNGDCWVGIEIDDDSDEIGSRAKTWPLALCAAALRARAAKERGHDRT